MLAADLGRSLLASAASVCVFSEDNPKHIRGVRLTDCLPPFQNQQSARLLRESNLALEISDEVEFCHARGIIHRDIKPSNIIVTDGGELRLIDFDVAAYRGARSTWPGHEDVRIGTLPYSAPEQILDPATATYETADIFSLGVVLYEMLTGRLPFPMTDDESEEEYRARLPFEAPVPPTAYRPDLAPEIEAVLLKAMRRDPAKRHQSAAELRAELESAFRGAAGLGLTGGLASPSFVSARSFTLFLTVLLSLIGWLIATT